MINNKPVNYGNFSAKNNYALPTQNNKNVKNISFGADIKKAMQTYYKDPSWFDSFVKMVPEKNDSAKAMGKVFTNVKKAGIWNNTKKLEIMDIGCARGDFTELYLNKLKKTFPDKKIHLNLVEFNPEYAKSSKQRFEQVAQKNKNISSTIHQVNYFKEPSALKSLEGKQNAVVASHSMYYLDHRFGKKELNQLTSYCDKKNGIVIALHEDPEGDFAKLFSKLTGRVKQTVLAMRETIKNTKTPSVEIPIESKVPYRKNTHKFLRAVINKPEISDNIPERYKDGINTLQFSWQRPLKNMNEGNFLNDVADKMQENCKKNKGSLSMVNQMLILGGKEVKQDDLNKLV